MSLVVMLLATVGCVGSFAQTSATDGAAAAPASSAAVLPPLPKEPAEIFKAAAPLYDFASPSLKPWHMKVSYQLYDEKGVPVSKGIYEYWWTSPGTYRSTWKRAELEHTDWHVEGIHYTSSTGEALPFFERKLKSDLVTPLPNANELRPEKIRFDQQVENIGGVKLPCIMVVPKMPQHGQLLDVPRGMFPTYCFGPDRPVLRAYYAFGSTSVVYNNIARVQGIYLARGVEIFEGPRRMLSATVDLIEGIPSNSPALIPLAGAESIEDHPLPLESRVVAGMLLKKQPPNYPQDAKDARAEGKVVLSVVIGTDGRVHELSVAEAPWPSLVASAIAAVSKWVYKPYLLNGKPVEVETTVNVIYKLG